MIKKSEKGKSTASKTVKLLVGVAVVAVVAAAGYFAWDKVPAVQSIAQSATSKNAVVAAVVNGEEITVDEVRAQAQKVPQLAELPFEMIYPRLLESVINSRVMLHGAEKTGLENDPQVQEVLKIGREQVLAQAYMAKQLEALVTPEQLQQIYVHEIQNFERPEEVRARHILVKTEKEANDVLVQLNAGADFAMVAKQKSLDQTPGGDLGYFKADEMIPAFSKPVFALKKGQLSKPINTPFGWHIVVVDDRRLAAPPAFEEVQEQLKSMFMEQHIPQVLEQERQKMNVEIKVPTLMPTPVETPAAETAAEAPAAEAAPAEAPAVEAPAAEAPAETPAAEAPAEAPVETPAPAEAPAAPAAE